MLQQHVAVPEGRGGPPVRFWDPACALSRRRAVCCHCTETAPSLNAARSLAGEPEGRKELRQNVSSAVQSLSFKHMSPVEKHKS